MEEIRKAIIKFKSLGRTDIVQKLQQELDTLEEISKNLDWKRYERVLETKKIGQIWRIFQKNDK